MKKIALIADIKGWAFDIAANIIRNSLCNKYKIDIYYIKPEDIKRDLFTILEEVKEYDIIHFFWRIKLLEFENEDFKKKVKEKYGDYNKYIQNIIPKISTGIYDHLFEEDIEINKTFTKYCNKYTVSSQKLFDIYSNLENIKKPKCIMGDSFEEKLFYPSNMQRFNLRNSEFIIGWAGNSKWNEKEKDSNGNPKDFKGFHTILKPVVDELIQDGYNIRLECADRSIKKIENDEMCEYYSKIHLYICVSNKEGTPKPLLEAMGCGVPIITTDVGVVKQALGDKQKEFILGERIIGKNDIAIRKKLRDKIIYLYENRDTLKELSTENYENSKKYETENMKKIYDFYFDTFN